MLPVIENPGSRQDIWLRSVRFFFPLSLGLVALYVLTRPCLGDSCPLLSEAENLAKQTLQSLEKRPEALNQAQEHLEQIHQDLQAIPFWSRHYSQAQTLRRQYRHYSQDLSYLLVAQALSKNAPLRAAQWQKIAQLWQESRDSLSGIVPPSPFFALAESQQRHAQGQLQAAKYLESAEKKGILALEAAQKAAQLATQQQNSAQSPQEWQLVITAWQKALTQLREVQFSTTSYPQAQQELRSYVTNLVKAQEHYKQEMRAEQYRQKAQKSGDLAQKYATEQKWDLTVSHLKEAIAYVEQVSPQTFTHNTTSALLSTYRLALHQAQKNQQLAQELTRICQQSQGICTFKIQSNSIQVILNNNYLQRVESIAKISQSQGDTLNQITLLNHINQLESYLEKLSQTIKIPLEVYNSQGALITRYGNP